jgi:dihydroxy-acid dehydratase
VDLERDLLECRELGDATTRAARAAAWSQAVSGNGGVHPGVRPVGSRVLRRMRSTARPALLGGGMGP